MLEFDILEKQIKYLKKFNNDLDELEKVLGTSIAECSLVQGAWNMLDIFIESHFTSNGQDLMYWWLYEDTPKVIYLKDSFVDVEELKDLWDYMIKDKETYFK